VRQFLSGEITTQIPASFLWLHPDVECFISSEAIPDNLQLNLPVS
jgi:6-phosphogluconolactonase/glucosamine-6-phosphate isomerase/deaminase